MASGGPDALLRLGFVLSRSAPLTPLRRPGIRARGCFGAADEASSPARLNSEADRRCWRARGPSGAGGLVGVNVGANKDSPDRIADYVSLIETFARSRAISRSTSRPPNTPRLRDLQQGSCSTTCSPAWSMRARREPAGGAHALLIKIAP